ncbi:MAG TPA: hypothetical protein VMT53_18680 [Terriglobales bacterium]|nr:hypothetical protein [Terriglobales bacterium]
MASVAACGQAACGSEEPSTPGACVTGVIADNEASQHAGMHMRGDSLVENVQMHALSGTDVAPSSTPSHMLMAKWHGWNWMLHGEGFINDTQQSGARGGDKLFSTNWIMGMGQRRVAKGIFTLRTMLSLEPATVTDRRYPELFQQGETAFGKAIVDGQHPHDFIMEVAALYDWQVSEQAMLSFYIAPQGDPAMGPLAYPHRASASEDALAPLGHHLQDSTHIAADVITAGCTYKNFRLEASGFHGREPDEYRWDIDSGTIDSWSTRLTINPARNWSFQYSIADLHSPEALAPNDDVRRMTASLTYNRPLRRGNWASMLLWGRNQSLLDGDVGNSFLLESTLKFAEKNYVWTRIENVDRTNELLLRDGVVPSGFQERYFARVQAYTAGYDRDIARISHISTAIGAQLMLYGVPDVLAPTYGRHPAGVAVFLRLRPD